MIRHVVIFEFDKEKATKNELAIIKSELEALVDSIPELIKMEVGLNANPEEKQDLVLMADVEDMAGLEAYAKHPQHIEAGKRIRAIATGRTCVDFNF